MSECNKIAVVIPLYNKAPHIAQTLDSVLAQTCTAAEIIVVDDGSEDGGGQIVENYASRGVTLLRQKNQGESAARNAGILAASAEYIAFLDADDHWKPNHLATLHELILRYPHAGLLSTAHLFYRGGNAFRPRSAFPDGWVGEVPDFFMAYRSGLSLVNSSTACSKRWAILQIGGFPVGVRRGPDIITWIKLALAFPVAHAEVVTSVYNRDGVNRSEFISEAEPPGSLKFIHEVLQDNTLDKRKRQSIGLLFDRIAIFTAAGFQINGDRKGVINILRLAFASSRYMCALVVGSIACFPVGFLCRIRNLRHRRAGNKPSSVIMDNAAHSNSNLGQCSISVIVPVYNSERTILRAIDSIARQSMLPCEVLLVDDCSNDDSIAACEQAKIKWRDLFPIRILKLDRNRGAAYARNRGWDEASGKYVAFLDADDSWHSEKLRVQSDFMEKNPEVSLSGHLCGIHNANMLVDKRIEATFLTPQTMFLSNPFPTPTVMVRNCQSHRFSEDMRYAEDYNLWLRMALDGLILARLECEMAILHKEKYGEGGLSANMMKMEKGELQMYCGFFRERRLSLLFFLFLICFSIAKYIRRIALINCRKFFLKC